MAVTDDPHDITWLAFDRGEVDDSYYWVKPWMAWVAVDATHDIRAELTCPLD